MATLYKTTGEILNISPRNSKHFTIEELHEFIGDPVDMRYLINGQVVFFHDNGKLLGLKLNAAATDYYQTYGDPGDYLAGEVLICGPLELEQDED